VPHEIDAVLAAHQKHNRYIAAARSLAPRPWAVGQWTLYRLSSPGHVGYMKHSIVAKGTCGFWLETMVVSGRYDDRLVVKVCFRAMPDLHTDPATEVDLYQAFMSRQGRRTVVIDFRNGQNPNTKRMVRELLQSFIALAWQSAPQAQAQDTVVPAGTFAGAARVTARVIFLESLTTVEAIVHSDVPIGGTLKSASANGGEIILLDFGLAGATSDLPDFDEHLRDTGLE
jgi:hypothetical protein